MKSTCHARLGALLVCLAALVSTASAGHFNYEGTIYPLRWGASDTNDTVSPYPVLSNPVCYQKSSPVGVTYVVDPGDPPTLGWMVIHAILRSKVTGTVYWTYNGPSSMLAPNTTFVCPGNMPGFIDVCELDFQAAIAVQSSGGGGAVVTRSDSQGITGSKGGPTWSPASSFSLPDIYVVLDTPKAPMSPAWCNVLGWACRAAQGESAATSATNKLTQKEWDGFFYDPSRRWWTRNESNSGETFYPRSFLSAGTGQCNDFADFLVCASTGVSALDLNAQRNNDWLAPNGFHTKTVQFAPGQTPGATDFGYHQYTYTSSHWDGAIKGGSPLQYILGLSTATYKSYLVDYWYDSSGHQTTADLWSPHTFKPTLSAGVPN